MFESLRASITKTFTSLNQKLKKLSFTRGQQQAFLEDVSSLVEDGVPASQAIETVALISKGTTREVARDILLRIGEGKMIADGMEGWFSQAIIEIIRAGEQGGTLAENMSAAARTLTQQSKTFAHLVVSCLYPLIVLIAGLVVSVFMKHTVFENFIAIKPIEQWPSDGRALYYIAGFIEKWWWLVIAFLVAITIGIAKLLSTLTGRAREVVDSVGLLSLYRDTAAARFMEMLGLLLTNGVVLKDALRILQTQASNYLMWHLQMMQMRLGGGRENIAEVVDTGLIPQADILRLQVIAKGRGFEHALIRLGKLAAVRNEKTTQTVGKILAGALLALGAAWAAFMIFAMYGVGSTLAST
ncbi:MAG: type II secretion system F family protein [Gammaproteobacteria bacterium]